MHSLQFFQWNMYSWCLYFSKQIYFWVVFSSMGICSIQHVWYLLISGILWTSTCLLICTWVVNKCLSHFSKFRKSIICLGEIFHRQIWIHFSAHYEKWKKLDGPPGCFLCTIQTNLVFSPTITPSRNCDCPMPPCIYNDPQQLQDNWTWLPNHSPSFSLPPDLPEKSNPKRLTSS